MVKNTNFGLDSKKSFLMHPKMHFFEKKWQFDPLDSMGQRRCQGTGGNFTPIFEVKKLRKVEEKCPGHFDSSHFSPKSAIFGGFEKKSF